MISRVDLSDCVMNAPEKEEYRQVLTALQPVLHDLPPRIVVVDGRPGVGKTTLSRFLAWRFNVSLLESDLFIDRSKPAVGYRTPEVRAVINHRKSRDRPIIVEGFTAQKLVHETRYEPDFVIRVTGPEAGVSQKMEKLWLDYVAEYPMKSVQGIVVDIPADAF